MSEAKNIKRNSTRPGVARRAYGQSMHGPRQSAREIKLEKEREAALKKLKSWNELGKSN